MENEISKEQSSIARILSNQSPITQMNRIEFNAAMPLSEINKGVVGASQLRYRFFQLDEVPEGEAAQQRLAMANVLSSLQSQKGSMVYLLSGTDKGISIYLGIAATPSEGDVPDLLDSLKSSFEGNFLGANLKDIRDGESSILKTITLGEHTGVITGVPSFNEENSSPGQEDTQGIERLVNSLLGETWQLMIVAEAVSAEEIRQQLERIYDISTELSQFKKYSLQDSENTGWQLNKTEGTSDSKTIGTSSSDTRGKNTGTSTTKGSNKGHSSNGSDESNSSGTNENRGVSAGTSISKTSGDSQSDTKGVNTSHTLGKTGGDSSSLSRERVNQRIEALHTYITETLINRYYLGQTKGLFRSAVYVSADKSAIYDRLASGVLSIFQGNQASMTPMQSHKMIQHAKKPLETLLYFHQQPANKQKFWKENALLQGIATDSANNRVFAATLLNTRELSLLTAIPTIELPGIKIRKSTNFAVNVPKVPIEHELKLGKMIQHGRVLEKANSVALDKRDLNKHLFICGVTGSGKTTTCMNLLLESKLPFLVIEPAKTEYRALHSRDEQIEYYAVGREDITPFRLNPFELIKGEQLAGHISMLNATLISVFPMEAAMPSITEESIIAAYKNKGWDIHSNENYLVDDPWDSAGIAWPTFSDMIHELRAVIQSKGLGTEFEQKYQGSLVARFTNLTLGVKGRMLNTRRSMDFDQLLDKRVVIELEEIKDEQDKALLMGLIIVRMAESMKHRHQIEPSFQHLTLVEEAHRLLSRVAPGESGSKKVGIDMFTNLLAEVRKYGEGLIIADQIPNKLVDDVIKNTNTKIVHRLFAADDRDTIGDTMALDNDQKDFLPLLKAGEAIIYSGGWHAPVWSKITENQNTRDVISESLIKNQGKRQLWQQRHRLLPNISKHTHWNEDSLALFMREGLSLLNLSLKIIPLSKLGKNISEQKNLELLDERFRNKAFQICASWNMNAREMLPELLADLLIDSVGSMNLYEYRAEVIDFYSTLQVGVAQYELIKKEQPLKSFIEEINDKKLDSI